METKTPQRTATELKLIDCLDEIDTELRKSRQLLHDLTDQFLFADDFCPSIEALKPGFDINESRKNAFSVIYNYPRIETFLMLMVDHLAIAHNSVVEVLRDTGNRTDTETLVIG